MTRNTLQYLNLKETERSNRVKESQTTRDLDRKEKELAETISNNLRNYGVNVTKNQITKLANDQLNTREANKIIATIQNNLRNQELKLQELQENERNNKRKNELEQESNDIRRMDTLLNAAKATGKTPTAILLSWFTNQANLQAFAGTNNFNEYYKQMKSWLESGSDSIEDSMQTLNTPAFDDYQYSNYHGSKTKIHSPESQVQKRLVGKITKYDGYKEDYMSNPKTLIRRANAERNRLQAKKAEENEVPEDYSSSYGPSYKKGVNHETTASEVEKTSQNGYTNTGISRALSPDVNQFTNNGSGKSSIMWSKGSKETSKEYSGPGIGLAFS